MHAYRQSPSHYEIPWYLGLTFASTLAVLPNLIVRQALITAVPEDISQSHSVAYLPAYPAHAHLPALGSFRQGVLLRIGRTASIALHMASAWRPPGQIQALSVNDAEQSKITCQW